MCGIVGLFLKDKSLEPQLGSLLTDMLITMTDRGPDSAGIAIYGTETPGKVKYTVQSPSPEVDFEGDCCSREEAFHPACMAMFIPEHDDFFGINKPFEGPFAFSRSGLNQVGKETVLLANFLKTSTVPNI